MDNFCLSNRMRMSSRIFLVISTKWPTLQVGVLIIEKLTLVKELAFHSLVIGILIENLILHILLLRHLTVALRRQRLRRWELLSLLWMPLHLCTMKRAITTCTKMCWGNSATPSTAASSDVTMPWIMNLMRSSHNSLFRSGRDDHSSWFLILNWSLRVLDLFLWNRLQNIWVIFREYLWSESGLHRWQFSTHDHHERSDISLPISSFRSDRSACIEKFYIWDLLG